jgi:hypothetical protein
MRPKLISIRNYYFVQFYLTLLLIMLASLLCEAQDLDVTFNVSHYNNGTNISCNGATNGTIEAVIVGGISPYSYGWNTGAFTKSIANLGAGTYTFTVTDANGTTRTKDVTLIEPEPLYLNLTLSEHNGYSISQQGGDDGIITANVGGGSPPYTYSWSNGGDKEEARHVIAGTYSVVVTDANGCVINQSATLTEPTPLHVVSITSPQHHGFNISCHGGSDGAIDLTVTGGVPPYKYTWTGDGGFSEDLTGLSSGDYSVRIEDGNLAEVTAFIALTEPADFKVVLTRQQYANGFNLSCHDCSNGSATAVLTGGAPPYSYIWSNNQTTSTISGLQATEYSVVATDINGCTVAGVTNLHAPDRDDWSMTGNLNTDPSTQFMGTTDNKDFVLRTNSSERIRIAASGLVNVAGGLKVSSLSSTASSNLVLADAQGNLSSLKIGQPQNTAVCAGILALPWQQSPTTASDVFSCWRRFGIGTDSPQERLDVQGNIKVSNWTNPTDYLQIGHNGGDAFINNYGLGNFLINYLGQSNGGVAKKTIINAGYAGDVEIGNPTHDVHLFSPTIIEGSLTLNSFNQAGLLVVNSNGLVSSLSGNSNEVLTGQGFVTAPWVLDGNNILTNVGSGNVGIGNSDPKESLSIGDEFVFHNGGTKMLARNFYYGNSQDRKLVNGPSAAIAYSNSGDIVLQTSPSGWKFHSN